MFSFDTRTAAGDSKAPAERRPLRDAKAALDSECDFSAYLELAEPVVDELEPLEFMASNTAPVPKLPALTEGVRLPNLLRVISLRCPFAVISVVCIPAKIDRRSSRQD
jgi:hypothetical protein